MILFLLSNFLMLLMVFSFIWEGQAWREVFSGRISLDSLRLITGIVDKVKLIKIFGGHDPDFSFGVSFREVLKARPLMRWIFGNKLLELFFFFLLWQVTWQGKGAGWYTFLCVLAYYSVGFFLYHLQEKKVHYQFRYEKLKKYGPKNETGFRFDHLGGAPKHVKKPEDVEEDGGK